MTIVLLSFGLLGAIPALAGDANDAPPMIELQPSGSEGIIGPKATTLASFSTPNVFEDPEAEGLEYEAADDVSFACVVDGRPVRCKYRFETAYESEFESLNQVPGDGRPRGSFYGNVPLPKKLAPGTHTVTVIATDEDGADPNPPTVEVTLDRQAPSKPLLLKKPARRSRDHKPEFRFRSVDDVRLPRARGDSFFARLRRVKPDREVFYNHRGDSGLFEPWIRDCPTFNTCTAEANVTYIVPGFGGLGLGMDEWLPAGVYDVILSARDAAGNKSARTRYRFRILSGRAGR